MHFTSPAAATRMPSVLPLLGVSLLPALLLLATVCSTLSREEQTVRLPTGTLARPPAVSETPAISVRLSRQGDVTLAGQAVAGETLAAAWQHGCQGRQPVKSRAAPNAAPMPPEPKTPYKTVEEMQADGYAKAAGTKAYTLQAIQQWELRELAPELAKYLRLPEREAPYNFMAAMALANWGYREGIDYFIERICIEEPGSRWVSIRFLSSGTGVNFFGDKARWQAWWKENRLRFPSAEEGRGDPKSE